MIRSQLLLCISSLPTAISATLAASPPRELMGNYVFRPAATSSPRGLAFFLGGAFVGAAPQLAYSALCQRMADAGYVVLATPFRLQFDYLTLCDEILSTAEPAHDALVAEYGELPVVGVGHSCGALLHVLLSSAFRGTGGLADVERVANCLISFNDKKASDAIPFFGELVAPAASSVLRLENDPLLQPWRDAIAASLERLDALLRIENETAAGAAGGTPGARRGGASPSAVALASQVLPVLDQIEPCLREIDGGRTEFTPAPDETRRSAAKLYEARRTLVLRFTDDTLDESPPLPAVLQRGGDVRLASLPGTHLTPLTPSAPDEPPLLPLPPLPLPISSPMLPTSFNAAAASLAGARTADFDEASRVIVDFLDESLRQTGRAAQG